MDTADMSEHKVCIWTGGRAVKKRENAQSQDHMTTCPAFTGFSGLSSTTWERFSWPNNHLHHSKLGETPFIWWNKEKCEICLYISGCKCSFWGLELMHPKRRRVPHDWQSLKRIELNFCSGKQEKCPWVYKHGLGLISVHFFCLLPFFKLYIKTAFFLPVLKGK